MSTVVIGITGSIAAYKAPMIASALIKRGVEVYAAMTKAAKEFITPLTLETICARPVASELFSRQAPFDVEHISLAKRADVFLVAPATANFIAKMAAGIADDFLSSTILATRASILVAPAMNTNMWQNPVTQANVKTLMERGAEFILPEEGRLACGDEGAGRLAEIDDIVGRVMAKLNQKRDFEGRRFLISAGPTREAIDPVRFLSNRSSGKMGYALAEAALKRGAQVTLVSGPVALDAPYGAERVSVTSAGEMHAAIMDRLGSADVLIMAAAVADYTPIAAPSAQKLKKGENIALELVRTKDILMDAAARKKDGQLFAGFAAETNDVERYALDKLARKGLDLIAANDVSREDAGFEVDTNAVTVFHANGARKDLPLAGKRIIADGILDEISDVLSGKPIS